MFGSQGRGFGRMGRHGPEGGCGRDEGMRGMRGGGGPGFGPGWGDREGGFGGRGGHARRGGGRLFEHGALKWVLLSLIADKPSHGYELIKAVEAKLGGAYAPSPGVIYPTLTLLEEMGALEGQAEAGKKLYSITDEGRRLLAENAEALARIDAVAARFGGRSARPAAIDEAVGQLRAALHARLTAETPPTEAQIEAIAAAVAGAAETIRAG